MLSVLLNFCLLTAGQNKLVCLPVERLSQASLIFEGQEKHMVLRSGRLQPY
jgi:hypothetical protein